MTVLSIEGLRKSFGDICVLDEVQLEVADGEMLALLGPSGSGKTTLLRMIAGLESIDCGDIQIDGRSLRKVHARNRDIAMVFQDYALYPHMSVFDNLAFPLKARRLSRSEIEMQVKSVAEKVKLSDLTLRKPEQLSGGQQQRLALGRALVRGCRVILMDEPLSNIDARLRDEMRLQIKRLQQELGLTVIYVTHDQTEAMTLGDRIAIINEGRIQQVGAPSDVYNDPVNRCVASFLGQPPINILSKSVSEGRFQFGGKCFAVDANLSSIEIGIRPEAFRFLRQDAGDLGVDVELESSRFLGSHTLIHARSDQREIVTFGKAGVDFTPAEKCQLFVSDSDILFFDPTCGKRVKAEVVDSKTTA